LDGPIVATSWRQYQYDTAALFRAMGFDAQADVRLQGVRTQHAIDVVVRSHHVGFDVLWLVECKHWKKRVTKLHVLALREIVADVGADRGFILSEVGFQSGAVEAAALTNIRATSLAAIRQTAGGEISSMRLRELYDLTKLCRKRYWSIPKSERIELGLRPEAPATGYSGDIVVEFAEELLGKAFRGLYPIECDSLQTYAILGGPCTFGTAEEVLAAVGPRIAELEKRLPKRKFPGRRPTRR